MNVETGTGFEATTFGSRAWKPPLRPKVARMQYPIEAQTFPVPSNQQKQNPSSPPLPSSPSHGRTWALKCVSLRTRGIPCSGLDDKKGVGAQVSNRKLGANVRAYPHSVHEMQELESLEMVQRHTRSVTFNDAM